MDSTEPSPAVISRRNNGPMLISILSFIALGLLISMFCISTIADDDVFSHLAAGRWIVEQKIIPDHDILSYPTAGVEWIPSEWGWEVLTYSIVTLTGNLGSLQIFTVCIWLTLSAMLVALMRRFDVPTPLIMFTMMLTFLLSIDRMTPRPHLISLFGIVLTLYLYVKTRYSEKVNIRRLYLLPVLFIVWCNMHPGVLAGLILMGAILLTELLRSFLFKNRPASGPSPLDKKSLLHLTTIVILCAAALLVTPFGVKTYSYVLTHMNTKIVSTIIEWQSPFSAAFDSRVVWIYGFALVICAVNIFYSLKTKDPFPGIMYLTFALVSLRAIRFKAEFAVATAFGTALSFRYAINEIGGAFKKIFTGKIPALVMLLLSLVASVTIYNGSLYRNLHYSNEFGFGLNEQYFSPKLMSFMQTHRISGRPFNQFDIGGQLTWELPGEKNFIDNRDFDDAIVNTYDSVMSMAPGFEAILERYGTDYIVLRVANLKQHPASMQQAIIPYCTARRDRWKLVYWDDFSFLYLKNIQKFQPVIEHYEYKILHPYLYSARHAEFDSLIVSSPLQFRRELERKISEEPAGVITNYLAQYARQLKLPGISRK